MRTTIAPVCLGNRGHPHRTRGQYRHTRFGCQTDPRPTRGTQGIEKRPVVCRSTPLRDVGYELRPGHPVPGRWHFAKIQDGLRTHNLSLTAYGSNFWEVHLLFRDYLRSHSEAAQAYHELKHRLAEKYSSDTVQYTTGKDEFIAEMLKAARTWRAEGEVVLRTAFTS